MKPITLAEAEKFDRDSYKKRIDALNAEQVACDIENVNEIIKTRLDEIISGTLRTIFTPTSSYSLFHKACQEYEDFVISWYSPISLLSISLKNNP